MQETKKDSMVANVADNDTNSFDELYKEIVNLERKEKKTKQIAIGLGGFLLGVLVTCGAWFGWSKVESQKSRVESQKSFDLRSSTLDSLRLDSLRLDSLLKDSLSKLAPSTP